MPEIPPQVRHVLLIVLAALIGAAILIDLAILVLWLARRKAVRRGEARPLFAPRWSLLDVWIAGQIIVVALTGIVLGFTVVVGVFAFLRSGLRGITSLPLTPLLFIQLIAQNALLVAVPAWFITYKYGASLRDIGLPPLPTAKQVKTGIKYGIVMMFAGLLIEVTVMFLLRVTLGPARMEALAKLSNMLTAEGILNKRMSVGLFLTMLIGGGVLAPIGEEFFFRGFLYNCAKRRFGVTAGILISAAVFAVIHAGPVAVLAIFPIGVLLAWMYQRTGSLWVTMLMHGVFNSVQIAAAMLLPSLAK